MSPSSPSPSPSPSSSSPTPTAIGDSEYVSQRERAFALHCEGLRSPAIGQRLGVSARTIRAWLQKDLAALARQQQPKRPERLALAVERHLAVAAAAWDAYHRAAACDDLALAHLGSPSGGDDPVSLPRPSPVAVRSLALALAAQREVARLQGLHIYQPEPERQDPQRLMITTDEEVVVRPDEMEAWIAFRDAYPREYDRPVDDQPASGQPAATPYAADVPAAPDPDAITAAPATAAEMAMPLATCVGRAPQPDHEPSAGSEPAAPAHIPPSGEKAAEMANDVPTVKRRTSTLPLASAYYYDSSTYDPWFASQGVASPLPNPDLDPDQLAGPEDGACDDDEDDEDDDPSEDGAIPVPTDWRERARLGLILIPLADARRHEDADLTPPDNLDGDLASAYPSPHDRDAP